MARWFKKTKSGGITKTTYLDGKPSTWSQSFGGGSYRQTLTHRGSKIVQTITQKMGGYTKITKKTLNKQPKIKKIKTKTPKDFKIKTHTIRRIKQRKIRAGRVKPLNISISIWCIIFFMTAVYIIKAI